MITVIVAIITFFGGFFLGRISVERKVVENHAGSGGGSANEAGAENDSDKPALLKPKDL